MRVPLLQLNFQQELDSPTKYFPEQDYGNAKYQWDTLLGDASTSSAFPSKGWTNLQKHSCARAAGTFCLKYLMCSVTLNDSQNIQKYYLKEGTDRKEKSQQPQWVPVWACTKDLMGYPSMLLPRRENELVIPGILRRLTIQGLEAEPGSVKLTGLRLWRALQILQDPNSI